MFFFYPENLPADRNDRAPSLGENNPPATSRERCALRPGRRVIIVRNSRRISNNRYAVRFSSPVSCNFRKSNLSRGRCKYVQSRGTTTPNRNGRDTISSTFPLSAVEYRRRIKLQTAKPYSRSTRRRFRTGIFENPGARLPLLSPRS